jgi:hypothetical protein
MPDDRPTNELVPLAVWLVVLGGILGPSGGPGLTEEETAALLDIARIATHTSERVAAPLTTFMAGVACAALPKGDRGAALLSLAEQLEERGQATP